LWPECLENRVVPAIVFEPYFGAEPTSYNGGPVLNNAPVYLLYWGSYWNTPAGSASQAQFTSAFTNELNSPLYGNLSQYKDSNGNTAGPAYINGSWTATEFPDPSNGFSDSQLQSVVLGAVNDPNSHIPSPSAIEAIDGGRPPLYLVITPPNIDSYKGSGVAGYHSDFNMPNQNFVYGWVANYGSSMSGFGAHNAQDFVTMVGSHEIGEALTDPQTFTGYTTKSGSGWFLFPLSGEVGDFEPDGNYTYRLNGSLVQALWDANAQAFTVSDGNGQNFTILPQWTGNLLLGYQYVGNKLHVGGDQLGTNYNDAVTVNSTSNGGLTVTLNGQTATFEPGQITSLEVVTGGGTNTVNILGLPANTPTTIIGDSTDTVTVGNSSGSLGSHGSMANINSPITVEGPGSITLNVDDSGDGSAKTMSLYAGSIFYGGANPVYYTATNSSSGGVVNLSVYGGSGGNTFNVYNTSNLYGNTNLNTGSGNDTANVFGTGGQLSISNPGGQDIVNVSLGSMSGINGNVSVNGLGSTSLYVNDSNDTTARTVTMSDGSLSGLGGGTGTIYWTPSATATGGVTFLSVTAGSGGNTFNVNNTSNLYYSTLLNTGTGNDTVNAYATTGALYDNNPGGQDTTNVGLGSVAGIKGFVDAYGAGSTSLAVDDHLDSTSRTVTLTSGQLTGLGNAGPIAYGSGVAALTVDGSSKASSYNIQSTAAGSAVTVNAGIGNDTFNLGSGNSLNAIQGALTVNGGGGSNTVNANDSGSASAQSYTLSKTTLTRSGGVVVNYASLSALGVTASGGDTLTLLSPVPAVPTTFNGGTGTNTLQGTNVSNSWIISGANSGKLGSVAFSNFQNLVGGTLSDTFTFTSSTASIGTINGGAGSGTNRLSYSPLGSTFAVTVNLVTGSAPLISGAFGNINAVAGTSDTANALIGPNTTNQWTISGANAGSVNSFSFTGISNLVGGTGVDAFKFSSTAGKVLSINGGGAPAGQGDWLDYSSLPAASTVTVNLGTSSATNVNAGAAGAVTGIQNVIGSASGTNILTGNSQGNVLIGGSGANTLTGGSGNSLLIGGSGHGTITGGAGEDVLIAGTTTYTATTTAGRNSLMAILAELQSADTFAQQVYDIIHGNSAGGGSDLNGSNKLTWGVAGATVKASTGAFTLAGDTSAGTTADWFFSSAPSTVGDFNDDGGSDEHNNNAIGVF
jgi:hypothetical protein